MPTQISTTRAKRLINTLAALALVNFFTFVAVACALGGDAINGRAADGQYFLSYGGVETEVGFGIWLYSYLHAISVFITHGTAFAAMVLMLFTGNITFAPSAKEHPSSVVS